ncbi:WD40 repeat-like protein [Aspergillus sclerotiicarbonarius CBS 121057]|uniref:WD40 repeat-like protein n=1 Tax=Aspergillus sclerotiicarbonarius (strain CBS 121057 / IBT 28362) TaxID=1448318 RepID=A0A319EW20_ASPSB|nr:WD40 repeat-like protein [Aspergillus sclerotiicarbonarius CBS 121057]
MASVKERTLTSVPMEPAAWAPGHPKSWGQEKAKIQLERGASTLAMSPDGKILAVGISKNVHIYNVETHERVEVLKRHRKEVSAVRFAPRMVRNRYVLISEGEGIEGTEDSEESKDSEDSDDTDPRTIFQWELAENGRLVAREKPVDVEALTAKTLRPLQSQLTADHAWDPAERALDILHQHVKSALRYAINLHERDKFSIHGRLAPFGSPPFSPDGQTMIYLDQEASYINLWDVESRSLQHQLRGHTDAIAWVGMSPDSTLVASIAWDGTARIWNASSGVCLHVLALGGKLWGGAFSPDGRYLAISQEEPNPCIHIYDIGAQELVSCFTGFPTGILCLAWSPDGKLLAGECLGSGLYLWDPSTGVERMYDYMRRTRTDVREVQFADGGQKLIFQTREGTVEGYDVEKNLRQQFTRGAEKGMVKCPGADMVVSGDSRRLVVLDEDGVLRLWDL